MEGNTAFEPQSARKGGKGRVGSLIVILLVVILLAVTNPSTDDFIAHNLKNISDETSSSFEKGLVSNLARGYFEASTVRDNYVVFSTFTVTDGALSAKFIGFLNGFFIKIAP